MNTKCSKPKTKISSQKPSTYDVILEKDFFFYFAVKIVGDEKQAVTEVAAVGDDIIIG